MFCLAASTHAAEGWLLIPGIQCSVTFQFSPLKFRFKDRYAERLHVLDSKYVNFLVINKQVLITLFRVLIILFRVLIILFRVLLTTVQSMAYYKKIPLLTKLSWDNFWFQNFVYWNTVLLPNFSPCIAIFVLVQFWLVMGCYHCYHWGRIEQHQFISIKKLAVEENLPQQNLARVHETSV